MALENEVERLVDQMRDLIPALRDLGRGAGGTSPGSSSGDKIVIAIGKLATQLSSNTKSNKTQEKDLQKFVKEVDRSADAAAKQAKAQMDAANDIDQAAKVQVTAQRNTSKSLESEYKARRQNLYSQIDHARELARMNIEERAQKRTLANVTQDLGHKLSNRFGTDVVKTQEKMILLENAVKIAGDGLGQMTKSLGSMLLQVGNGSRGFDTMNSMVDVTTAVMGKLAAMVPFVGAAVQALIQATGEASKFVLSELQKATDSFNQLGATGLLTAQGMTELQGSMLKSGMSMTGYNKIMVQSSAALSRFSGTAGEGRKRLSAIIGSIVDSDTGDQLRRLGMTADEIGEFTAGYITQQTRLGRAQGQTNEQLRQGSVQYISELDRLTKITGLNRAEAQAEQDSALSDARFRAASDKMIAEGRGAQAKATMDFTTMFAKQPEIKKGLQDMASGLTNTDASLRLLRSTGGEAAGIMERLKNGQISEVDARRELQASLKNNIGVQRDLALVTDGANTAFIDYAQVSDVVNAKYAESINGLIAAQTEQKTKGTDPLTDSTVKVQKSFDELGRKMQTFAFEAMPAGSKAVAAFAGTLNEGIGEIGKLLGIDLPGLDAGGGGGMGNELYQSGGSSGGVLAAAGRGFGATVGQGLRSLGRSLGIGGHSGGNEAENMDPANLFNFRGGITGHPQNFQQLDSGFRTRLAAMAKEYSELSGRRLDFESGARSQEQNQAVNGVDTSNHMAGKAVDLSANSVTELMSMGLLDKYGFKQGNGNLAHISDTGFAKGGIASGPKTGYSATLHGTEAVVPLPDGKSIPVANAGGADMGQQMAMLERQLGKFDEMITAMRKQVSISEKILSVSYS